MKTPRRLDVHTLLACAFAAALSACGGGDDATPAAAATTPGTLTVSAASKASRNGSYTPTGAVFASGADSGFNGQTADGKFELEVVWAANGTVKKAHVWFNNTPGTTNINSFFGCDGAAIACNGVSYEPASKQVIFTKAALVEVADPFSGGGAKLAGGETLTLDGSVTAK